MDDRSREMVEELKRHGSDHYGLLSGRVSLCF
jgi:hypothetical protein